LIRITEIFIVGTYLNLFISENLSAMRTLKLLIILCIFSDFGSGCMMAQTLVNNSCQLTDKNGSLSSGNLIPLYKMLDSMALNCPFSTAPDWMDLTKKPGFTFSGRGRNYYELINVPTLLYDKSVKITGNLPTMEDNSVTGTFNYKLERLTGKSLIDTTSLYSYPLKRTNSPAFTDRHLYRGAAFLIMRTLTYSHPQLDSPPKYPLTDISRK
jgi:hypothetical protein